MFTHPDIGSQVHRVRHREMLAHVRQQRLGRQLRDLPRRSRCAEGTHHSHRRTWYSVLRLRRALT